MARRVQTLRRLGHYNIPKEVGTGRDRFSSERLI